MAGVRARTALQWVGRHPKGSSVGDDRTLPLRPQSQLSWSAREFNRVGFRVSGGGWRPDRNSSARTLAGTHPIGRAAAGQSLWRRIRELPRTNLAAAARHLLIEAMHIWVLRAGLLIPRSEAAQEKLS